MTRSSALIIISLALLAAACNQDPLSIIKKPDASLTDGLPLSDAFLDGKSDMTISEAGESDGLCKRTNDGVEICDGKDNDCNGVVDDVLPDVVASDAKHCGKCNNACTYNNAFGTCEKGACKLDTCAPGYHDSNKNWTDGCEYQCLKTNGGVEECPPSEPDCACDNADNDCDKLIDEVFDKESDINNCGSCGNRCLYNHAEGKCTAGKCSMGDCEKGYSDLNQKPTDGCEYACPIWPTTVEKCNGKDDDCDTLVDEGSPGSGQVCNTGQLGECALGKTQCQSGKLICEPNASATLESCDGKDNNCDGKIDEDYSLQSNVKHCGRCNNTCSFRNGIPICDNGVCKLDKCAPGYKNLNALLDDGCEHKCAVWPSTIETCNGKDDDCDMQIDEDFDTQTSLDHCGQCNNKCSYAKAKAQCASGKCLMGNCEPNYYNINTLPSDGCEYYCRVTNNSIEICDNVDNDCDGKIDDGFNLATDPKNCGTCGNQCSFNNAAGSCNGGKCKMGACDDGYKDLDASPLTGCEYKCPVWPPVSPDECDGVDNDCDSKVDEDFSAGSCGTSIGECSAGTKSCVGGSVFCKGGTGPKAEICDDKDNDCDDKSDEDFDKQNDPRYCGNCTKCSLPNAIANCTSGVCGIAVCLTGYVDLDQKANNGCEYQCTVTGREICDGFDNDCNGKIDTADDNLIKLSSNPCITFGACSGASPICQGTDGWVCSYSTDVELKTCTTNLDCTSVACTNGKCLGEVALEETKCDNVDNDCDGQIDEVFSDKGNTCKESGKTGICQGSGTRICNPAGTGTMCDITQTGQKAQDELCNGKDDDCDGQIDEEKDDSAGLGVVDAMIHIQRTYQGISYDYYIYTYEASRPDASSSTSGTLTTRACSKSSVYSWANITYHQAEAACAGAGKRLCTPTEWYLACAGPGPKFYIYPYGNDYNTNSCNGKDYSSIADTPVGTGTISSCQSRYQVFDMSGNLKEWTNDPKSSDGSIGYTVRGGSYDNIDLGLSCDNDFVVMPPSFYFPNLGFRCCSDTAP